MRNLLLLFVLMIFTSMFGCQKCDCEKTTTPVATATPTVVPEPTVVPTVEPTIPPTPVSTPIEAKPTPVVPSVVKCEIAPYVVKLGNSSWQKDIELPATGKWVLESSLATKEDVYPDGRLFPKDAFELIDQHLARSCEAMKKMGFQSCDIHKNRYVAQYTPPEGGKAGQGAVGNLRPSVIEEMFTCNQMWRSGTKPKPCTKFLMSGNGKHVVVCMGYEVGPGSQDWLGGCQGEVFSALGGTTNRMLKLSYLKDQSIPLGPIVCD